MSRPPTRTERHALALGLLHGPAELVPVSSSAHVAALTWLLGWDDAARRKELEVALHFGSAAALLLVARPARLRPGLVAAASAPAAIAGLAFERRIEQRLGTPATLAAGLLLGAAALVIADRTPAVRSDDSAGVADGLFLGLAQATALMPGVSRSGATLAAARARGFDRASASRLSWEVALPVVLGASALKGVRVASAAAAGTSDPATAGDPPAGTSDPATAGDPPAGTSDPATAGDPPAGTSDPATAGDPPAAAATAAATADSRALPLAAGAAAAFVSTLVTARVVGVERRAPLWPWAAWRVVVAGAILAVRHNRRR